MKYTRSAIGLLTREYRSVLKKCLLINLGLFALGAATFATPAEAYTYNWPDDGATITSKLDGMYIVGENKTVTFDGVSASELQQSTYVGTILENQGTTKIQGDSSFIGNQNGQSGGVIYNFSGDLTIDGANFTDNSANAASGAIHLQTGKLIVRDSEFTGNKASEGGAIESHTRVKETNESNHMEIYGSTFTNNEAEYFGALGIFGVDGTNIIKNSHFIGNSATSTVSGVDGDGGDGGAVFLGSEAKLKITGSEFKDNTAANDGGAIATRTTLQGNATSSLVVEDSTFTNNTASATGGAIYANVSEAKISGSTFEKNSANMGGAVYNDAHDKNGNVAKIEVTDSSFVNNTATTSGGAMYNAGEATIKAVDSNVVFEGNTANSVANDLYNKSIVNLNAAEGKEIAFKSGIDGVGRNDGSNLNVKGAGTLLLDSNVARNRINIIEASTIKLGENGSIDNTSMIYNYNSGATLDLRNGKTDTIKYTSLKSAINVYVDADTNGNLDKIGDQYGNFAGAAEKKNLQGIQISSLQDNLNLDTTGYTVTDAAKSSLGAYYDNIEYDSVNNKITAKKAGYADLIGIWEDGNYIKAYDFADAKNTSVAANLKALDDQVFANAGDIATNADNIATNTTAIAGKQDTIDADHKLSSEYVSGLGSMAAANTADYETKAVAEGKYQTQAAMSNYSTTEQANALYAAKSIEETVSGHTTDINSLKTTVGDADNGLVKDVNTLKNAGYQTAANVNSLISDSIASTEDNTIGKALSGKVNAVAGKQLSTEDFTTAEKNKLADIAAGAQVNKIESVKLNGTELTITDKAVNITAIENLADDGEGYLTKEGNNIKANRIAKTNLDTDLSGEITASTTKLTGMTDDTVQASINTAVAGSVKYTDISKAELPNRKAIVLKNHDIILGTDKAGNTYNLAMLSKWDVADFGSDQIHMNLNSKDGVATLNDNQVVLTDQLLNKVVAANGNIVMTESDVASTVDGIAHKKYTFSTKPDLNAKSLTLASTETENAALTMNGTSVNSIDQVEGAAAGNNVLASKATVNKAVADVKTEATEAYNRAHNWAEYVLGVDVDENRETQLQTALNKLGASAEQGGDGKGNNIAADNIAGALHELDVEKFATANIVTTTNNLASTDATVYSAAKADAVIDGKISNSILAADADKYMYNEVKKAENANKSVSAGAFAQFAQEIGYNMKQDQLGWDINVDTSNANSFSEKLNSAMYNGLTKKTTERTVVSALNTVGNAFEDKLDGETVIGKKTVVESIQDALSNPEQDIVADDVHANTIEAYTSLKVGTSTPVTGTSGRNAAAIELGDNDMPYVAAGSEATLATTASLNQAVNNVLTFAGQTFNAKQQWLDGFTGISSSDEEGQQHAFETSFAGTYNILEDKDGDKTTNMNLAKAFKNIDSNMGKIHGLVGADGAVVSSDAQKIVSTTGTHSNLAKGTSVEMHLVSLDNTIGDRSTISNENGSNSYALTARTNVADVLSDIASQIGKAGDLTSTINGVALTNTVNTNISAVNSKLGNVSTLGGARIDAVKTSTNAIDAILALDTALQVNPEGWRAINALTIDGKSKGDNTRTAQTLGDAIFNLGMNIDRINENKFLSVANDGKTATMYDKQFEGDKNKAEFYTTAGAEAKFYAKDEQLDGSKIGAGSIAEGSLAEAVTAKLNKANTALQAADLGSEFVMAEGKVAVKEIAQSKITGLADDLAKKANVADYKIKTASDEFTVADGQLSVNSIAADKISGLKAVATSGNFADLTVDDGAIKRAMIADGAINKKKLAEEIKDSLDLADTAVQEEDLAKVAFSGKYADLKVADGAIKRAKLGEDVQASLDKADSAVQNGDASLTLGAGADAEELTAAKIAQITTNAGLLAGMGEGKTVVSYVAENAVNGTYNPNGTYATDSIGAALQNKADANNVILRTAMVQTLPEKAHLVDADADRVASVTAIVNGLDRKVNTADVLDSVVAEPATGKIYDAKTVNSELAKKANDADLAAVAKSGNFADLKVENGAIITKMIENGAVTYSKLGSGVQASLDLADSSLQGIAKNSEDYITVNGNNKLKVGKIKVSNIDADAFGDIIANGTNLVKSGTIYTYFQGYAKLGGAANFSSLTLGTAATGQTLPQATAISNGTAVAAQATDADATTLATNLTVRNTVDTAISSAISDIDKADHTWKGNNIFEKQVRFDKGINVAEEDLTVAKGDINVTKGDIVVAEGTVQTGSLTLNGDEVTAIDTDGTTITTADGSASTLATTSTVMKSAQNAEFSAGTGETLPTSVGTAGTIHAAIVNVATAVDTLGDKVGTVTFKDADGNPTTNNIAATTTDLTSAVNQLDAAIGNISTIKADYAKTIDATTGAKSDPADIATAIQNVALAAAAADGTLNFTEAYTTSDGQAVATDGSNKAADITTAINNVARNAAAAAAGISAEIHGTGTEIAPAGEVKVGNLAATTTVGTVDSNNKLTGMKVSSTATVDTDEDGTPDSKALNIAVSGDGRSTNIDMTETEASMTATNNGRTVGMLVTNDGSDTHTVSLGEDGKYVIEIDTDAKTTKFGKDDGKEVVIGEGDITADKSVTVGSVEGAGAKGVKLDATDGSITSTGNANIGGNATVTGDLSAAGGNFTVATDTTGTSPVTTMTLTGNANITGDTDITGNEHVSGDVKVGTVDATTGDVTSGVKLGADGTLTTTGNATVGGALGVTGKTTLSADNGMAFGDGQTVKGIDNGATPVTGNGSAETLATTATVMASAENAKFTPAEGETGVTKAATTLHAAIAALDDAMGTMVLNTENKNFVKRDDSGEIVIDETTGKPVALDNATDALNALDGVVGNVKGLNAAGSDNLAAQGKTVAEHLAALDKRLGKIHGLFDGTKVNTTAGELVSTTGAHSNLAKGTTVENHLVSLDNAIGNRTAYNNADNFTGYVAVNDGSKDLTTMISEVASNIGEFKETYSTNLISSEQTVNANLSALDGAIGNMTFAEDITADDLTSVINNVDAKLNHSNEVFSKAINQLDYNYRELRHDFEAGMASQAALSALVPNGRAKGDTQLSVGTGMYKGHTAAAVGGFHWFTDNLLFNAGVAWDNAEATGRMGVTYSW